MHLGDSGRISVQARELHARGTVAEGDWSRVESRHRQDTNTRDHLAPPPQDHCNGPLVTQGGVSPSPVQGPSQAWGLLFGRSTVLRMQTHSVLQVSAPYGLPFLICKTSQ